MNLVFILLVLILQCVSVVRGSQHVYSRTALPQDDINRLSEWHEVFEKARIQSGIPGMSVGVLHKGSLVFAEGFGKRNEHDPFTAETLAQIASLTKAFTAAAIGELVAEGKMDWDKTPVSKYLPEFELQDPVLTSQLTIQDLLSHRTPVPPVDLSWWWNPESRRDLIKRLKHVKMDSKLRADTKYNNVMYGVAGEAAANVVGMSYEDLVTTKVFKPLGLSNTGFSSAEMKKYPNYAMPYDAASFTDAQNGNFIVLPLDNMATTCAPSGDIYSNVLDLVRWGQTIMHYGEQDGRQVLNKESVTEMLSAHAIADRARSTPEFGPSVAYGMGWVMNTYKGNILYGHNGSNPGFVSNLILFPDAELVIACLGNVDTTDLCNSLCFYIADELLDLPKTQDWINVVAVNKTRRGYDKVAHEVQGDFPKRIENKPSMHDLDEFVGEYSNPIYGDVSIRLERSDKEKRALHIKLRVFEGTLEHYHYNSFTTVMRYSTFNFAELVTFTTGENGKVAGFQIELLDQMQEFKRKEASGRICSK